MSQIEKHLKWCFNEVTRLKKVKPNYELAQNHLKKSEYNSEVLRELEGLERYDWAINVGFHSIYHCFLAILARYGYESKNQSCTITVMLALINDNKIWLDKDLVLRFDTIEVDKEATMSTIRQSRERSTYGVRTKINVEELDIVKELMMKIQRRTIEILEGVK